MKSILTKKVLFLALVAVTVFATGCIKEDLDECYKLTLKVVNHKGDDITALSVVSEAKLFIYDNNSKLTVRGNGVAGGNQEIVLEPKTGTVEMRTLNLQYALTARGLRATDECDFYMDRTLNTIDYKGELTGDSVYYNPEADWKDSEWETTGPQALYLGQNMTGSIQVGNDRYEVKEGTFDDGTTGPIEIHPFQRTLVLFAWGEDGAFLGARIKVTPWGVVDDDIEW